MIYSSYDFLLLLPPLVVWFYNLRSVFAQNLLMLLISVLFLAWTNLWNLLPAFVLLLVVFQWFKLDSRYRLGWRGAGLVISVLVLQLAYMKYRGFIGETFGVSLPIPAGLAFLIPLGISFYTFEAISAIVDIKRRQAQVPAMSWALFIMFLPHLVAGPIVRWRLLSPQFTDWKPLRWRNISVGFHLFTIGFLKKLAADPIGQIIDPVWSAPAQATGSALLLALLGFYAQLYLDFSGYTDMGRGIARMLGYRLPLNFRAPFFAHNPAEFYQRWHVSLSSWIRTFVYDTLAVAVFRRVRRRKWQNRALFAVILVVMALFGLWHGSAWHFVLFGVAQGFVIAGWAMVTKGRAPGSRTGWVVSLLVLQVTWLFSLIFFRSDGLPAVAQFLRGLGRQSGWSDPNLGWCLLAVAVALLVQAVDYHVRRRPVAGALRALRGTTLGACAVGMTFAGALALKISMDAERIATAGGLGGAPTAAFIYFRF
jgi:alginate O-acetyltransferase complex protein AlgI